jgi:hypothetical protein
VGLFKLVLDPTQIGSISQIGFTVPCHRPSAQGVLIKKSGTAEQGLRKLKGVVNH